MNHCISLNGTTYTGRRLPKSLLPQLQRAALAVSTTGEPIAVAQMTGFHPADAAGISRPSSAITDSSRWARKRPPYPPNPERTPMTKKNPARKQLAKYKATKPKAALEPPTPEPFETSEHELQDAIALSGERYLVTREFKAFLDCASPDDITLLGKLFQGFLAKGAGSQRLAAAMHDALEGPAGLSKQKAEVIKACWRICEHATGFNPVEDYLHQLILAYHFRGTITPEEALQEAERFGEDFENTKQAALRFLKQNAVEAQTVAN